MIGIRTKGFPAEVLDYLDNLENKAGYCREVIQTHVLNEIHGQPLKGDLASNDLESLKALLSDKGGQSNKEVVDLLNSLIDKVDALVQKRHEDVFSDVLASFEQRLYKKIDGLSVLPQANHIVTDKKDVKDAPTEKTAFEKSVHGMMQNLSFTKNG